MQDVLNYLVECKSLVLGNLGARNVGQLCRVSGLLLEVEGLKLPVGSVCVVEQVDGEKVDAEVVGFNSDKLFLMPLEQISGLLPGAKVYAEEMPPSYPVFGQQIKKPFYQTNGIKYLPMGDELLGRVVDAQGKPLDSSPTPRSSSYGCLKSPPINPLERTPISEPLDVGVRAINSILTVGKGQRIGLFAGSGVGKSVLLGMMAKYTRASRVVVGLIGERGREVKEFIEQNLGEEGLMRSVVVAAPADCSPLLRMQGAAYATSIAEHFREQGHDVLLIMDSLTRYAMAQRELALSMGEPPATKGYPPSVFAKLPALVERAGNGKTGGGSITAFYTVLTEGDDQQDPIADSARAILDGHIVLSRSLADAGHYPAIDIEKSISRVMQNIVDDEHIKHARELKSMFSKVMQNRDLLTIGAYSPGNDPGLDRALEHFENIERFLKQEIKESSDYKNSLTQLLMMGLTSASTQPAQRVMKRPIRGKT